MKISLNHIEHTPQIGIGSWLLVLSLFLLPSQGFAQIEKDKKLLTNSVNNEGTEAYVQELLDSAFINITAKNKELALIYSIEAINLSSQLDLSLEAQLRLNDGLAGALSGVGAHRFAIKHYKKAIELTINIEPEKYFGLTLRYGGLGSMYLRVEQTDSALYYFKKAIPAAINHGNNLFIASTHNNLGMAYAELKHDSALFSFNYAKTILTLSERGDSALMSSINDNLADLYFERKEYSLAEPLFEWNYNFLGSYQNFKVRAQEAGLQLAAIYLETGQLKKLQQILFGLTKNQDIKEYSQRRRIYHLTSQLYVRLGNKAKELQAINDELQVLDLLQTKNEIIQRNVANKLSEYSLKRIEKQLELEKLKTTTQKNQLDLAEQKAINRLTIIWASILSGFLIIVILYLNYRKKIELRRTEQERVDNELALKKRDLEDFALEIVQNQEWTDKLSEKLLEIKNLDKEEVSFAVKSLLKEVKGTQIAAKQKKVFQQNIAEVNHSFFEKLNQQFGNLTKAERELAGLLRMELSTKEVANLRNVEVNSVKRSRTRLRKKLNLSPETDIYNFLKSI